MVSEKGIEAGNLSDYINNNEEEVLKLAQEFKKPKFKVDGKVEAAADKFKCGGKAKKVKKAQDGDKMSGKDYRDIKLNRGVIRRAAKQNFGFNNAQFQTAYENAKYGFRNQGLNRREANIAAQRAMINKPQEESKLPTMNIGLNRGMSIDRSVLDRATQGPRKVFIDTVLPSSVDNNYKINTNFNWDTVGNDLEIDLNPVYGNRIFDGGDIDQITVTAPQINPRPNGDNIIDFFRNINFAPMHAKSTKKPDRTPIPNTKGFRTKTMPTRFGLAHYQGGGSIETPNGYIYPTYDGYVDIDGRPVEYSDKLQNIRDRHNSAKKRVFARGNTSYDMTVGHDLDLFNEFNGDRDTLIRKSVGFRSPKTYSNEDIGHKFETAFPNVAKFFGYKSGYQKVLDEINSMQDGGIVKESIKFGPEYKKFEDNTGRYERVVLPKQDTV